MENFYRRIDLMDTYVLVGDIEAALSEAEYLLSHTSQVGLGCLRLDPFYAPLRADPRSAGLLANVGSG